MDAYCSDPQVIEIHDCLQRGSVHKCGGRAWKIKNTKCSPRDFIFYGNTNLCNIGGKIISTKDGNGLSYSMWDLSNVSIASKATYLQFVKSRFVQRVQHKAIQGAYKASEENGCVVAAQFFLQAMPLLAGTQVWLRHACLVPSLDRGSRAEIDLAFQGEKLRHRGEKESVLRQGLKNQWWDEVKTYRKAVSEGHGKWQRKSNIR